MSKTALVTGASNGIGRATAERLVAIGYTVHGTYNTDRASARELQQSLGIIFHQADFTKPSAVPSLLGELEDIEFHAIVNNAGVFELDGFSGWDHEVWSAVMAANLDAPVRIVMGLRDAIARGGAIVNVASLDGMVGSFHSMAYSASKAALINLTLSLANNFGARGIRVNAISPGWIETAMATQEARDAAEITPLGRSGVAGEVADLAEFLLSERAAFITGANVVIDGGFGNVDYVMLQESRRKSGP